MCIFLFYYKILNAARFLRRENVANTQLYFNKKIIIHTFKVRIKKKFKGLLKSILCSEVLRKLNFSKEYNGV
jgi:hypothetical protein